MKSKWCTHQTYAGTIYQCNSVIWVGKMKREPVWTCFVTCFNMFHIVSLNVSEIFSASGTACRRHQKRWTPCWFMPRHFRCRVGSDSVISVCMTVCRWAPGDILRGYVHSIVFNCVQLPLTLISMTGVPRHYTAACFAASLLRLPLCAEDVQRFRQEGSRCCLLCFHTCNTSNLQVQVLNRLFRFCLPFHSVFW